MEGAIDSIRNREVDSIKQHEQVRAMYSWKDVAIRTEKVFSKNLF